MWPAVSYMFQSTRPHGARRPFLKPLRWVSGFNPRARTGRDPPGRCGPPCPICFNPRARTGRDSLQRADSTLRKSFNPRARTGRDVTGRPPCTSTGVSIHAPARGATCCIRMAFLLLRFQSTRPHGARRAMLNINEDDLKFQSTRPHGARLPTLWPVRRTHTVSIHAPARGATAWRQALRGVVRRFNPRARTGRDGMLITQPHHCKKSFAIANLRALSRKNGKDHDRRSDASTKTTACRNANLRGGQRSLGVRGTRAGAANCSRGAR